MTHHSLRIVLAAHPALPGVHLLEHVASTRTLCGLAAPDPWERVEEARVPATWHVLGLCGACWRARSRRLPAEPGFGPVMPGASGTSGPPAALRPDPSPL